MMWAAAGTADAAAVAASVAAKKEVSSLSFELKSFERSRISSHVQCVFGFLVLLPN